MDVLDDTLKDLYNGKINLNEKFPTSEEYNLLIKESKKLLDKIESYMDEKENKLLNEYIEKQSQITSIDCEQKFIEGYKLASKLIIVGIK